MSKFAIEKILKIKKIRYLLYKRKLKSCGKDVVICSGTKLQTARKISIGNNVRIGERSRFSGSGGITIGNNVSFGPEVVIWSVNHNFHCPETLPYDDTATEKAVTIEDNVWVGARVCIVPGVTIGEGAVVAMGAVVTKDVPPCAVVGGNPAKVLKYRDVERYEQLKREKKFVKL